MNLGVLTNGPIFLFGVLLNCQIVGEGKGYVIVLTRLPELAFCSFLLLQ